MNDPARNDLVMIDPTRSTIDAGSGPSPTLEISLPGTPHGIVLLLCESGRLARDAATQMNHLAENGYESLAVELGDDVLDVVPTLLARAAERGWSTDQVAVLGLDTGGRAALTVATVHALAAAVSFSAPLHGMDDVPGPARTPWLGMFGASDDAAPAEDVRALAKALDAADIFTEVVRYPGVGHDFHARVDDGVNYAASYDGWQRTIEWLDARVAPRLSSRAVAWRSRPAEAAEAH